MIKLLLLPDEAQARTLQDYLRSQGIATRLENSELGVSVWLQNDAQLAPASAEVRRFVAEPYHPRYQAAAWQYGDASAKLSDSRGFTLLAQDFFAHVGGLTLGVLALLLAVYGLAVLGLPMFAWLSFPANLAALASGELWRYVTPVLLHFSVLHLVFNALWWWYLGGQIELKVGMGKLLLLLLVGAVLPNVAEFLASGPQFGGLSGVVYALLGYTWLRYRAAPAGELQLPPALMGFMLFWLVLGWLDVLWQSTANWAHSVGLLVGLAQGAWDARAARRRA
ncbi:MAG: rhomboid family intramembrane serine protease GlpG [Aeromonas sp.]